MNAPQLRFPGQKPCEQIQILVRKHWIIDLRVFGFFLSAGILPPLVGVVAMTVLWEGANDAFLGVGLAVCVYLLFVLLATYIKWLNQELDIIIVTNERILSHDQIDLFHREISETSIMQVQDVKGTEKGFLGHMLHYGSLEVQTAARDIVFTIQHVANPYERARAILDVRDHYLDTEKFEAPEDRSQAPKPIFDF